MSEENVKVRFAAEETGWARREDGKILLSNIPQAADLTIDDEVELGDPTICSCCPTIRRVVNRQWPLKSKVHYAPAGRACWIVVSNAIRESGLGWTEGWGKGVGGVAHTKELTQSHLNALLADSGVTARLVGTIVPKLRGKLLRSITKAE